MPTRSLPPRPDLQQLKRQAKELLRDHRAGKPPAAARIAAHHPRIKGQSLREVLNRPFNVAGAQLVLAREYGFPSWAALKHHVELGPRIAQYEPHPQFDDALAALDAGDIDRLRRLLHAHPDLVHARTNLGPPYDYVTGATLLHFVARNPMRPEPVPHNLVAIAQLLLEAGADVNASTLGPGGGTTMGLLITSKQASDANISGRLMDLLLRYGAEVELTLTLPLANHAPRAAEKMIELGAKVDVCAAAALGRLDLLRDCFDASGHLRARPMRNGRAMTQRDAIGLALLFAYVNQQRDAVDFVLEHDGNWNMTGVNNGTALHRAAWTGDLSMVQRLVAKGADITNRENPFTATPLSWAQHNQQEAIVRWMRTNCAIDLHDAVCFHFREHVEARLREDPASVNELRDQWEIPRATPLHWAAWLVHENVEGKHAPAFGSREELVQLLLDHGADPNIVAGNGRTALDIAHAAQAHNVLSLLKRHGGRRAAEL